MELQKNRSISEVLVDSLLFIKYNFKPFFKSLLFIAGPLVLLNVILGFVFGVTMLNFEEMISGPQATDLLAISLVLGIVSLIIVVLVALIPVVFIKLYLEHGADGFDPVKDVWKEVSKYLMTYILLTFLIGIITFFALMLFVLPGIYLYVSYAAAGAVLVLENERITDSLRRSFRLVSGYWWHTFFAVLLVAIVTYMANAIFSVPAIITGFIFADIEQGVGLLMLQIASSISTLIGSFLPAIISLAGCMIYFDLKEKKEGKAIMDEINAFK